MKCRIAVVQCNIKQFAPEENLTKAERYISTVSSKADLIVFPEDFITGPLAGRTEFADREEMYKKHFQSLARLYKIDIVPGSVIEQDNHRHYNTTYYIESSGEIKARYRKINLWHPERDYLTPGHDIQVFSTNYGKTGLIICWDLIFPEVFREMTNKGVEIVICPSYWCYGDAGVGQKYDKNSEIKLVDSLCVSRAFENEIVFVYCNAAGQLDLELGKERFTDTLIGHSQITVPFKGYTKKLDHNLEEMFIEEIDTTILKDAEDVYRIRKDLGSR